MLNFQVTKPACSTSPRNTLAAHCRPNNLLCKQHRLVPAAPFLPSFQQCQGMEHCTGTGTLPCHALRWLGCQQHWGQALCAAHRGTAALHPLACVPSHHEFHLGSPGSTGSLRAYSQAPSLHTDSTSALEHTAHSPRELQQLTTDSVQFQSP